MDDGAGGLPERAAASAPTTPSCCSWRGCCAASGATSAARRRACCKLLERPGPHFASVDAGLRGYKARHNLAVVYHQQGRAHDAEAQWRRVTADRPDFLPGWLGRAEVALRQGAWGLLGEAAARLDALPRGPLEAAVLRGRALLARREFAAARAALEAAAASFPRELAPRVVLTHVLLQEGGDLDAAERRCATCWPWTRGHNQARRNLDLLLRRRTGDAATASPTSGAAGKRTRSRPRRPGRRAWRSSPPSTTRRTSSSRSWSTTSAWARERSSCSPTTAPTAPWNWPPASRPRPSRGSTAAASWTSPCAVTPWTRAAGRWPAASTGCCWWTPTSSSCPRKAD